MPRLTRIYTRKGDDGSTGLGTGERVQKNHPQVDAYGDVDELNASIGVALAAGLDERIAGTLQRIQSELLNLGGELSVLGAQTRGRKAPQLVRQRHVDALERSCDELNADLGPLENFILPGGVPGAAALHVARTVCRRAERKVITLAGTLAVPGEMLSYLNRLSDLLFIMARHENRARGVADVLWDTEV
ncbi:MAG: cob(I)yrinic acid a,c-diamide adenosyltransferase [Acidobacteriota bacterium]|nr:cob(I)yrinic acid a,c-diamide adenosyltransferase [Acidobacteriota bacterium]